MTVAVMFQLWQMTCSTAWIGVVGLVQAIPIVTFGLVAGSVIDRVDRRAFYLTTVTGQALCSILLAVQGFFGRMPVVGVVGLVAVQSCFVAGSGPASRIFILRLLPPRPASGRAGAEPDLHAGGTAAGSGAGRTDPGRAGRRWLLPHRRDQLRGSVLRRVRAASDAPRRGNRPARAYMAC